MAGTLTRLSYQQRNKHRVNVFIDDAYAFSLPDVLAASLQPGQYLDDETIAELQAQDARQRAMDKALRLLARRPRSQHEIDEALKQADFAPAIRQQVISRLHEMAYLDDRAFARWWVTNRIDFSPRSSRALQQELYQKGIAPPLIADVLAPLNDDQLAIAAGQQRAHRWQHLARPDFDKKMLGFLQRRGFSYSSARLAIDYLWQQVSQSADSA